nr:zinc-ribbon domain-containing protein [Lysinibacillus sp. Bpr_S20]
MLKVRPELFDEWDFEKNSELGLDICEVTKGMHKKAWWICLKCNSNYDIIIKDRVNGQNCPYCRGLRVNYTNSLASLNPQLASQWHPTKNGDLSPHDITCNKNSKIWWLCEFGHEWDAVVSSRNNGASCPYCSSRSATNETCLASVNPKLASEWHPTKNGDKSPFNILPKSNEKVWWLGTCGHEWDAIISNRNKENGTNCPYCAENPKALKGFNDIWTTNPELGFLLLSPENGYKYTEGSSEKVDWRCSDCGEIIKNKDIYSIKRYGLSCPKCSDGIKYPEKFMMNLLKQLRINFEYDTTLSWSNSKRYDFYLDNLSCIIETHGGQHYEKGGFEAVGGRTLQEEQENDRYKKSLALKNDVIHYIVIDCRNSELDWIKNSILNSKMNELFNLSKIDWEDIHSKSLGSFVKIACDLWNSGMRNVIEIGERMKLSRTTIRKYLKQGAELNWCDYNVNEVRRLASSLSGKNRSKAVVQLDLNNNYIEEWISATEASRKLEVSNKPISSSCTGRCKSAYGFKWMYKKDYEKYIKEQKQLA